MIDSLGRYQLVDMRDRVRRLLDAYQLVVTTGTVPTGGVETSAMVQDQSFSNIDINNQVNESLISLYCEMIVGKETLFASTRYLSINQNDPGPYSLPPDCIQLRWMKWKSPSIAYNPSTPTPIPMEWYPMVQIDDPADWAYQEGVFDAPTWRWESGMFYLNEVPPQANLNGIQMNIVTMPTELVKDTDVISMPQFVRIVQQAVIYDAAYTIAFSKRKQVENELAKKRDEWHARLTVMVQNAYNTQSTQLIAPRRMIRDTYTGRFRRIARGGSSF